MVPGGEVCMEGDEMEGEDETAEGDGIRESGSTRKIAFQLIQCIGRAHVVQGVDLGMVAGCLGLRRTRGGSLLSGKELRKEWDVGAKTGSKGSIFSTTEGRRAVNVVERRAGWMDAGRVKT